MNYTYDENGVRYNQVKVVHDDAKNWVFLPGGPGADSRYLLSLVDAIDIKGNIWLVDLPGAGDNDANDAYDFNNWFTLLPSIVSRFTNCILVAHSFGGVLPLLSPPLEKLLLGLVIINSAPTLWLTESEIVARQRNVPVLPEREVFMKNPTDENYKKLRDKYIPYYFNKNKVEEGFELFKNVPFQVKTMLKVFNLLKERGYNAEWIPQKVKAMIIGGDSDFINPFKLFEQDKRFNRNNIRLTRLENCGHWCWVDGPDEVKGLFDDFAGRLDK